MTKEAQRLRAQNNLAQLSPSDQSMVRSMVCSSVEEARYYTRALVTGGRPDSIRILEVAMDYEKAHHNRTTVLNLISSAIRKLTPSPPPPQPAEILPAIPAPAALLSGDPSTALSAADTAALTQVDTAWADAARLTGLIKNYARAGTAGKVLCGIILRSLRSHYAPRGGRPKKDATGTWETLLADKLGITRHTASNWINMADAVQGIAEAQGLDLRATCEKLPWDWSAEESAWIDATVVALCQDRTQRQLLQADFLSDLGYSEPTPPNTSHNPTGKNGGKKTPAATPAELLAQRQIAARLLLYGVEVPGKVALGSHAKFLMDMTNANGLELEALPRAELVDYYENDLKPYVEMIRKLIKNTAR